MTQIRLKRGTTVPLAGDLVTGELAIDTSTGTVYTKKDDGTIVAISGGGGGGGSYLPLAGGTMTGAIVFDGTSGQYINKGNFDTSRGGNYGISLVCSIGYEFNWQAGWLTTTEQGTTTPRPLYLDSSGGTTLRCWDSESNMGTEVTQNGIILNNGGGYDSEVAGWGFGVQQSDDHGKGTTVEYNGVYTYDGTSHTSVIPTGIVFSDLTTQTTAGVPEAPSDGVAYVRKDGTWAVQAAGLAYGGTYEDFTSYTVGQWVVYSGLPYVCISANVANYPDVSPSFWTPLAIVGMNGTNGTNGTNGSNGLNGAMNYLDMLTVTSSSAGLYVSGGYWYAYYGFMNTSGGWFFNKLNASGVDFKFYINGTYDSTANGAYNYYSAGTSYVTTPNTGDIMTVFISDGTNESSIPLVTMTF